MTPRELRARALSLLPVLRERAAETERLRHVPEETVRDLIASRLVRIGNPDRFGGLGVDYPEMFDVAMELGRVCGSTAWCYGLWTVHNWWVGFFPEQAQEEYYAQGPDVLASSGLRPDSATAQAVDGGFRISGRWSFSSGCDAASWAFLAIPWDGDLRWVLVPRRDFAIDDNWHVSGLSGSGSKDIVIQEAFVPAHRTLDAGAAGDTDLTGWRLHGRPSYRVPMRTLTGWDLVAPVVGMAQGAVDECTMRFKGTPRADSAALQLRLAQSTVEIEAARALIRCGSDFILQRAAAGSSFTELERARLQRDKAYIARLALQAVDRLFEAAGAHSILASDPLQRLHRDAHAATHHATMSWDTAALAYGRLALGPASPSC